MSDRVAVIIPCHNYARFLPDAINSVLGQTLCPTEILVVDDASTDRTIQVARQYADQGVRYPPRRILPCEAHDRIHDDLSDAWLAELPFVTRVKFLRDEIPMPSQDGIRREDGRDFPQSLATDGMSLYGKQSTLVIVEQQSLPAELLQQGFDLGVLELDDLLLTLVHNAAEGSQHDVPWLEQEGHVRRRNRPVSGVDG